MKRIAVAVTLAAVFTIPLTEMAQAGTDINISIGLPIKVTAGSGSVFFSLSTAPEFIEPQELGFYAAVDTTHNIYLIDSVYYLYRDRVWYTGNHYNGPWYTVERRHLPPGLRKHKHDRIRYYRDEEYRRYRSDRVNYEGRRYRPEHESRDERRERREEMKEQRREMREERKEEKFREKQERKEERGEGRGHGHGKHGD